MNTAYAHKPEAGNQILKRAQDLIPSLRERAERIAETRSQPDDVIRDLYDNGLMELMRPRRFGGREHGADLVTHVGRALGRGDGSTSWVYMVTAAHDAFMPLFSESVQEQYWKSSRPVGASSYMPTGKAVPGKGGFVLSGKWSFCSGIDHAGWVLLGAIVGMLENPTRPDFRYFMVPDTQYKIIDDWYVMGLRGTGSKSVGLENVFVPDERILTGDQFEMGVHLGAVDKNPQYRESVWVPVEFSLSAPATGIAQTAYEVTVAGLRARTERGDPIFAARKPAAQVHLAEAHALIDTSELIFDRALDATFVSIGNSTRLNPQERARNRLDTCYSIKTALEAVEILMGLCGGSGLRETHPVQRALRDLYAVAAHPGTNWDAPALAFGSLALGGSPAEQGRSTPV